MADAIATMTYAGGMKSPVETANVTTTTTTAAGMASCRRRCIRRCADGRSCDQQSERR
jgi:hypothetical protein